MAVRQYVGARYVPQIMGDWNDQTVYEPLSVVTYNFGSYTSKKAVPAGVEPTNEEYWALTGSYNAQVEGYRQEVEALKDKVTELETTAPNITNEKIYIFGDNFYANNEGLISTYIASTGNAITFVPVMNASLSVFAGDVSIELFIKNYQFTATPTKIYALLGEKDLQNLISNFSLALGNAQRNMRYISEWLASTYPECVITFAWGDLGHGRYSVEVMRLWNEINSSYNTLNCRSMSIYPYTFKKWDGPYPNWFVAAVINTVLKNEVKDYYWSNKTAYTVPTGMTLNTYLTIKDTWCMFINGGTNVTQEALVNGRLLIGTVPENGVSHPMTANCPIVCQLSGTTVVSAVLEISPNELHINFRGTPPTFNGLLFWSFINLPL